MREGCLPPRSDLAEASSPELCMRAARAGGRFLSDRIQSLNGTWQFRYFETCTDAPALGDIADFGSIEVPSVWQTQGFGRPQYVNVAFPIPAVPPRVPNENPLGVYRKSFFVHKDGMRKILHFSGVAPCAEVHLNGRYIGYSEVSHSPAEYDVTDALTEGENELTVLVYKWCSGTYLENQDMFRHTGIFRDVYLISTPEGGIFDVQTSQEKTESGYGLTVRLVGGAEDIAARLFDGSKELASGKFEGGALHLSALQVREWSAETPNLYTLLIENPGLAQYIALRIGFKTCEIRGKVFYLNGRPIKFYGVNHHDSHPTKGFAVSFEDMEGDVRLIKQLNCNAVRTSHYPPSPDFVALCSEYGLYVIDEADIECHGAFFMDEGFDRFAEDPVWEPAFLDRITRLYERDKNAACVVLWSLGNESGGIRNHDICAAYIKSRDPSALIHYEGAVFKERKGYDVVSMMYPTLEQCVEHSESDNPMPFFMCEYAHAMGTGPGGMKEYRELVDKYPSFMGGCIWEFCDHAVYERGEYRYGGEFGETLHDGNFCCDGLVLPDRSLSRSAIEAKACFAPLYAESDGNGIVLENRNYFAPTDGLDIWLVLTDGKKDLCVSRLDVSVAPREKLAVPLPQAEGAVFAEIYAVDAGSDFMSLERSYYTPQVRCIRQLRVAPEKSREFPASVRTEAQQKGDVLAVRCGGTVYSFHLGKGTLVSVRKGGKELLCARPHNRSAGVVGLNGFVPSVWRAPTDNDRYMCDEWSKHMYDAMWYNVTGVDVKEGEFGPVITVSALLSPPKLSGKFRTETVYRFGGEHQLEVETSLISIGKNMFLPRFGVDLEVKKSFAFVRWEGLGPEESYSDFREAVRFGEFRSGADELVGPTIVPQGGGQRSEVGSFILEGKDAAFRVTAEKSPISFTLREAPPDEIARAAHHSDVRRHNYRILSIDGFSAGLGSQSCGSQPLDCYKVFCNEELRFCFGFDVL